jgi:hypothetical protein
MEGRGETSYRRGKWAGHGKASRSLKRTEVRERCLGKKQVRVKRGGK